MAEPVPQPSEPVCCGKQRAGTWLPKAGEPQVRACQLCPDSGPTYWRNKQNSPRRSEG